MCSACEGDYENPEPIELDEAEPDAAQAVADDAARRMARNTTDGVKQTALAMGVKI